MYNADNRKDVLPTKKTMLKKVTEKLIHTGFFHIFGASTLNQVFSFLSGIILVRVLSKDKYGVFANAFNYYQLFMIFSGLGISVGILQMCSEYSNDSSLSNKIYQWSSSFGLKVNLVLALCIAVAAVAIPMPLEGTNQLLMWFCLLPIPTLLYDMSISKLRGDIRAKEYAYSNVLQALFFCGLSIVGALLYESVGLIVGRYIAFGLSLVFMSHVFHVRTHVRAEKLERSIRVPLLKVSLVAVLNNGLSSLFNLLEVFILGIIVSDSTVTASYKVASTIPSALVFVPNALVVYVYPYFARHIQDKKWLRKSYFRCLAGLFGINLCICMPAILLAKPMILFIFSSEYFDAVKLFQFLMVGYCINGTFRIMSGNLLASQRKYTYNLVVSIVGATASLIANVVFIPIYGSMGAAIAHVIVIILTSVLNVCGFCFLVIRERQHSNAD